MYPLLSLSIKLCKSYFICNPTYPISDNVETISRHHIILFLKISEYKNFLKYSHSIIKTPESIYNHFLMS